MVPRNKSTVVYGVVYHTQAVQLKYLDGHVVLPWARLGSEAQFPNQGWNIEPALYQRGTLLQSVATR